MNQNLSYQIRYTTVHIFYQIICVFVYAYASVFLVSQGFTESIIGAVIAGGNVLAAFLQPMLGAFLDRNRKVSAQLVMLCLLSVCIAASTVMLLQATQLTKAAMMVLVTSIAVSLQPLINSLCFLLEAKGVHVNFGVSRGIGSGAYALFSIVLGSVLTKVDAGLLPLFYLVAFVSFGVVYCFSGTGSASRQEPAEATPSSGEGLEQAATLPEFMRRHRAYMLFLAGMVLIFLFQGAIGNYYIYQLVEALGGTTKEMGYAVAIAAGSEIPAMAVTPWLCRRYSSARVLRLSAGFYVLKYLLTLLSAGLPAFYVAQALQCVSFGLFFPATVIYAGEVLPSADLMKGQTLLTAGGTVANILASALGGVLIQYTSVRFTMCPLFLLSLLGALIIWRSVKNNICKIPHSDYNN